MEAWERTMGAMAAELAQLRSAAKWQTGPSDFLGVVGRSRDELTHSTLLGWLLDSSGRHGLESRLTDALLCAVGLTPKEEDRFVVRLEVSGESSRADLVLVTGDVELVIENKIDAMEQPFQCKRLARDHPDACALIFLTPTGRSPITAGSEHRWHSLRWSLIADLLEAALQQSEPAPARYIAEDYLATLRREMP